MKGKQFCTFCELSEKGIIVNMKEIEISVIGIIVENLDNVPELNGILSAYGDFILGRMGIPHTKRKINIITIIIEAENETINSLKERIDKLDGIGVL